MEEVLAVRGAGPGQAGQSDWQGQRVVPQAVCRGGGGSQGLLFRYLVRSIVVL